MVGEQVILFPNHRVIDDEKIIFDLDRILINP